MRYIVAYDIANPRRLNRVSKILADYGFRIQKSIFEVELDDFMLRELNKRIDAVIEPTEDGVKYFQICGRCVGFWFSIGLLLNDDWHGSHMIL